ncbi:MAG: PQQ-binding-like beta-propeller repeat protein [Chloroflexi bacterium]|nr:PQQ-binding-like beta-propeller repeat protein [Chloroflexota bacterium]
MFMIKYDYLIVLFIIIIGLLVTACIQPETAVSPPTQTPESNLHPFVETKPIAEVPASNDAQIIWQTALSGAVNVPPAVEGDQVIVATADGQIHGINAATGAKSWQFSPDVKLWDASLRVGEGMACIGLQEFQVTCLDATTGTPRWTAEIGLEMQSRPALVDGILYAPTTHVGTGLENNYEGQARLVAIDANTGDLLWEATTDNYILRRPIVMGDLLIVGGTYLVEESSENSPTRIYAFDSSSGEEQWRYESEDGLIRWLVATENIVVFAGSSEIIHGLAPATGELIWSFGPSYWMQFPVITDGKLFFGSGDERMHALDAATGAKLWEQSIDLDSLSQIGRPLLLDNQILFNAVSGDIYGLRLADGEQLLHLETGITARVGGALHQNLYIMGDPEGDLYAYEVR